jgi:hypothetical protein
MRIPRVLAGSLLLTLTCVGLVLLAACSINVKKKGEEDKNVDINTPIGGIHVSNDVDVKATGLPVYPGSRPAKKENDNDEKSANVNISSPLFGLKVVAQEFETDAPPDKLVSFYTGELKKYGKVLECHGSWNDKDVNVRVHKDGKGSKELSCDTDKNGDTIELKVGSEDNQHLVSIKPQGKGSHFALVLVQVHSKDETI